MSRLPSNTVSATTATAATSATSKIASPDATNVNRYLRTFSLQQIEDRAKSRTHIPEYRSLLMESAVESVYNGIVFDVRHPSWLRLLSLVQQSDAEKKAALKMNSDTRIKARHNRPSPLSSPSSRSSQSSVVSDNTNRRFDLNEELSIERPNISRIRRCALATDVSPNNRAKLWSLLLSNTDQTNNAGVVKDISGCQFDLYNQRVIRLDIERTCPDVVLFRQPRIKEDLERVITVYCKRHLINYKQGLNYIVAPLFVVLDENNIAEIYSCLTHFIRRLLPNTFSDDQFGGLQSVFRMFRLLLLYHAPKLCNHLDDNDMSPELYASAWFLTMFANRFDMMVLLCVWDHILLHSEPLFFYFFSIALLIHHTNSLMNHNVVVLPEKLSTINVSSKDLVNRLSKNARRLLSQTPEAFLNYFRNVTSRNVTLDSPLYSAVANLHCMPVSAEEIVSHCFKQDKTASKFKYFVIDCRPATHYNAGHLPLAYHLDPGLYLHPEKLARRVEILSSMQGCHFCFLLESNDSRARQQFVGLQHFFIQKGFQYVSSCHGGFHACHTLVMESEHQDLVDHNPSRCMDCIHVGSSRFKRGFLASVRERLTGRVVSHDEQYIHDFNEHSPKLHKTKSIDSHASESKGESNLLPKLGVPDSVVVLPPTTEMWLLFSSLRNRSVSNAEFTSATRRLLSCLVASALEDIPHREALIMTPSGKAFVGIAVDPAVVGVGLCEHSEQALQYALAPFTSTARCQVGCIEFREKFSKDSSGVLRALRRPRITCIPDGNQTGSCKLLVFAPVITNTNEIVEVIAALLDRGFGEGTICVLTIVGARSVMWALSEAYPYACFVVGAIDEKINERIAPGIAEFRLKYDLDANVKGKP